MQVFKETTSRNKISVLSEMPTKIMYAHCLPAKAHFSDETNCSIACLGCLTPRCMYFSESEVCCDAVSNFPYDKSLHVCPVDAIKWDDCVNSPSINNEKCITCGICISRCPVGALFFDGKVNVNLKDSPKQKDHPVDDVCLETHRKQIAVLERLGKTGVMITESNKLMENIYRKLFNIPSNYYNQIGRNLLIALGCKCSMRRIGDVYTRMDAIYSSSDGIFGAVEIEFGRDTLDASRGVLDDIAVLYTRYGVDKVTNKALVICLQLPNARQGYWQVVKDIMFVENIKINTITIGALLLLVWNGRLLRPGNNPYYVDFNNMSIREALTEQINRKINLSDKELGILEPLK